MKQIKVKTSLTHLGVGETPTYRLITKEPMHVDEREFLRRIAERMGQNGIQARYWLDAFRDVLFTGLAENECIDLSFMHAKLHVAGSLTSPTAQPTKADNPVRARVFLKGELADMLAQFAVVNDTLTVDAVLYEIKQDGVAELNRIESPSARIVINGKAILIDADQTDNGVWLEDLKSGVRVADGVVSHSDSATCYCTFPTLPATGKYRLAIATRDGNDPTAYTLAKVTRIVSVVHEPNA